MDRQANQGRMLLMLSRECRQFYYGFRPDRCRDFVGVARMIQPPANLDSQHDIALLHGQPAHALEREFSLTSKNEAAAIA